MDELVNIPALLLVSDGGTQSRRLNVFMVCTLLITNLDLGKSGSIKERFSTADEAFVDSIQTDRLPRKTSRAKLIVTVLKPTQVVEASSLR